MAAVARTRHSGLSSQNWWREALGAIVVLITRIVTAPATPWENDEFLFAEAVRKFDPSNYHPHPPGYPLFVLLGKAFSVFVDDPWRALVVLGIVAAPVGFVALALAFRNWIGDADLAVAGALLYYFSASMLVHGTLALSDGVSIAFLALALHAVSRPDDDAHERNAIAIGVFSSAAIGCRPQLVVPLLPMLAVVLWRMRTNRQRVACAAAFAFVSLMWFLPLVDAAGGFDKVMAYETRQAAYVAAHDANVSRGARSVAQIVIRFVLHPWGSKYITLPLMVCIALGVPAFARRARALLPLIVFTVVQLAFELVAMDPADGARYSLPAMILFALIVALGLGVLQRSLHSRAAPYAAAALFAGASWLYVVPIVGTRTRQPSPPVQAAAYAASHFAPGTVVLYDTSLKPHAEFLLARFRPMPIEKGLDAYYDRPDVPLVMFLDGGSTVAEARTFSWPPSDAYGKLTRNVYRQVTLDPVRPAERYLPLRGIYALERTIAGDEWRWLQRDAALRLPRAHGSSVTLGFRLPPGTPYHRSVVQVSVNGAPAASATAQQGEVTPLTVPLPAGGDVEIRIHSDQAFVPDAVAHNRDKRSLSVQLTSLEGR
jgi:hypothetical protein